VNAGLNPKQVVAPVHSVPPGRLQILPQTLAEPLLTQVSPAEQAAAAEHVCPCVNVPTTRQSAMS
jgi:hypothetical protein